MTQVDHISQFRLWLQTQGYSSSTVRNYIVDINKYLSTLTLTPSTNDFLTSESLFTYITAIKGQNNNSRQLASLSKFCQYALDQKLIDHNPLPQILRKLDHPEKHLTLDDIVTQFSTYLATHHKTPATVKNYLNDLKQYFDFINSQPKA